ncbi:MAG TPA: 5'/3'-nucleotidase SurE [Fimbriimonadaceae bacterium]|nr:5'/3'-nucleotidase SurE [Fimbriimonadaceae bacterium]
MKILVTNDDGIHAEGLRHLVGVAMQFGEVKVVAPDAQKSACGHGMTMRNPLRVHEAPPCCGMESYTVDGLPVDCVNVGLTVCWPDGCDLVLSGINDGPNLGFDVTYSGTVAAAMEAAINGIRGVAISMAVFADGAPFHFETGAEWLAENWSMLTSLESPPTTFWNVNVPAISYDHVEGHRFVRMGDRVYEDRVVRREDPWGRPYYWQGGVVVMNPDQPGTDVEAVNRGFVAITPIGVDWTDVETLRAHQSL